MPIDLTRKVVVDTREQTPWEFADTDTIRAKLDQGDYSLEGLEHIVSIERKSLQDLVGSITGGRPRFMRELERMRDEVRWPCIIVECDRHEIAMGQYRSRVHPNSIIGTLTTIWLRFGVPCFLTGNRELAALDALRMFHRVEAELEREEQAGVAAGVGSKEGALRRDALGTDKRGRPVARRKMPGL